MFKTIKEVLRTGNATVKYPFAPLERPKDARGKPEHDAVKCMACSACAVACPPNAIQTPLDFEANTKLWSINYGRCVFCGRCEEVCPTNAIILSPEFELAVMSKADLEEICVYSLQACVECGSYFAPTKQVDYVARILSQNLNDEEAEHALESVRLCPQCKQKADVLRFKEQSKKAGEWL
ncbi:MAG: formate hydrogenlyase complex iron-sulfur subunit [Coriobacteriia bacterium]|nr:formate hydrogenlyase complex iron-sulfur subunit [Coriobacteriia bacterium]MCL2750572.1 formate hydrogenlyase complex iron-sulfur subunit [Coriobacteriia bacterium]